MIDREGLAARYAALTEEVGPRVKVVVATKYVDDDEFEALSAAGVTIVGENRMQDLERKHDRYADAFRWHFIGQLQSRKAPEVSARVELVHSLSTTSAARKLSVPSLVQVNLAAEDSKAGVDAEDLRSFVEEVRELGVDVVGLSTMPPLAAQPEDSRPYFRRLAELAAELKLTELSMGTTQDYRVAVEEGATFVRVGSAIFAG